ncbi:MAG: phage tail protein, partial [Sarcina sp.]
IIEYSEGKINYEENKAPILTFKILPNCIYFNSLKKFIDLIEVYKLNENKEDERIFDGRVLDVKRIMTSEGKFYNNIICEGTLNYLVDSRVGVWELHPDIIPPDAPPYAEGYYNTKKALEKILNNHNSKVENKKKIYLGNITLLDNIYFLTNRETSLNVIYDKLVNKKGGFLNLRESSGKYYLDYLKDNPEISSNNIEIGLNLRDIQVEDSIKSICTRLIGIGDEGKISSTAEDAELIKKYGVIEEVCEWKDVTIQENLDRKVKEKLQEINNNNDIVSINALDLSYIDNNINNLKLGQQVTISCEPINYSNTHRIISINLDLLKPYDSTFQLNNNEPSQINSTSSILQETSNNKLEILQINGRLIQKVSSSEFQSYREQTDRSIIERVSSSEFESYKEQTDRSISTKVSDKEFSTKVEQNSRAVQIAWNNCSDIIKFENGYITIRQTDGT